jgi:hypothetical protein
LAVEREIGLFGLCKFLIYVLLVAVLAGKFITGEWLWGGEGDVRKALGRLWPAEQRLFSESLLGEFDGSDPSRPIFIAVRFAFASPSFLSRRAASESIDRPTG